MSKLGRNDPCWCGKINPNTNKSVKYKKCHLDTPEDTAHWNKLNQLGEFGLLAHEEATSKFGYSKIDSGDIEEFKKRIAKERHEGSRPKPSDNAIFGKSKFNLKLRKALLDMVANIVDQNWCGRSEMCVYFAIVISEALKILGGNPKVFYGNATYSTDSPKDVDPFTWLHGWVEVDGEIIDGNIDSVTENPMFPKHIKPLNYWGASEKLPDDRILKKIKEINNEWIKENTSHEMLQKWIGQIDIEDIK